MKLGEMQRYSYQAEYTTYEGDFGSSVDPDDDGEYVLFSDAQAKSLADERRIAELEKTLADALHRLEWFRDQKGMNSAAQIEWARAAPRVETQETGK